ncbi:DUF4429 domain-containing protein [Actinokineospora terrae]|uniref:DUF4429 domain-containing protein n=1 Tax=Actinokineospora terrae TaxID=155974 RepID=A0A1H9VB23_9PSEU|nr:DUF4429 domain-containing protein [Actinokineospora terrae]SES18634.1 hypothetical protein SAMN04487818_108203 [Actinokineospora terrae]
MDGIGISVTLDGGHLSVTPTNAVGRLALGGGPLTVDLRDIAAVTVHEAGPLRNGRLDLRLRDGRSYQLAFTRAHQDDFARLQGILVARRGPQVPLPRAADLAPPLRGRGFFNVPVLEETAVVRTLCGPAPTGERVSEAELRLRDDHVQVLVEGYAVGILSTAAAYAYRVPLERVGGSGRCRVRLWWTREHPEFACSVALDLAEPEFTLPLNTVDPLAPHLPPGRPFRLTGEREHLDVLVPLMDSAYLPGKALVVASLHLVERAGPRSTSMVVALRVDGRDIGELGRQTSGRFRPLVGPLEEAGLPCHADVVLVGNAIAVEGKALLTPPEELPDEFIQRVRGLLRA